MHEATIKRLELVQNLIALEEDAMLDEQADKLEADSETPQVQEIAKSLRERAYGKTARLVEKCLSENAAVQKYEDPEVAALRLEVRALEDKLANVEGQRSEIEKEIHDFNTRYQRELGDLLVEILELRKEKTRHEAEANAQDERKQEAYEEAQADYEDYQEAYEEAQEETLHELTPDEEKELKSLFRQASKRCHPDTVDDEHAEDAAETFSELEDAYRENDLERVREIADMLENGHFPGRAADEISDVERLRAEVSRLRDRVQAARRDVEALEESDPYQTLTEVDDRDAYFADRRERLEAQLEKLREEVEYA